jgi:hypothetical protein
MGRLLTTSALALLLAVSAPVGAAAEQGGNGNEGQGNQGQGNQSQGNQGGKSDAGNSGRGQNDTDNDNDDEGGVGGDQDNRGHGNNRNQAGEKTDDPDNPGAMKKGLADSNTDGNSGNDEDEDKKVADQGPAAGNKNINFGTINSTLNSDKKLDDLQDFLTGLSEDELKALIDRLEYIEVDGQLVFAVRGGSRNALQNAISRRSDELEDFLSVLSADPEIAAAIDEKLGPDFDLEDIVAVDFVRDRGMLMIYVQA